MTALYKKEKMIYRLITMAVLAAALFFVYRIVNAALIALPYPRELLEASNVALTEEFLSGRSPYSAAALGRTMPGINYDYPFLNSLIAAGLSKITGIGAVTAHYIISLSTILASGMTGYVIVRKYAQTTVAPMLTAILFMFCHWRFGYISAAPDDLGLLMLLITTLLAVSDKVRNKPFWCAVGITLCFYSKQYFVFVAPGIFVYMLLYSRKDAIKLIVWSVVINAAVAALITLNWPLYWTKAFLLTYLGTVVGGGGELATVLEQFKYLIVLFAALFAVIVIAAAKALRKLYKSSKRLQDIRVGENDAFALSAIQSVIMIIPLFVIGRNDGAVISYFLQLWIPFVTVVAVISFERMMPEKHEFVYAGIYAAIVVFTIYLGFGKLPVHMLTPEEAGNWQKAYDYVDKYSENGDIYYSRCLAYRWFDKQNGECSCGHDGEVSPNTISDLTHAGIDVTGFSYLKPLVDQNMNYRKDIADKAKNHEYSLITVDDSQAYSVIDDELATQSGYTCIDRLTLQLGNMPYDVSFYAR